MHFSFASSEIPLDNLQAIKSSLEIEISNYNYEAVIGQTDHLIGIPTPIAKINSILEAFKRALVNPYWEQVLIRDLESGQINPTPYVEKSLFLTDNSNGYWLAYLPNEKTFAIIDFQNEQFVTGGVFGDAVGCFLAM